MNNKINIITYKNYNYCLYTLRTIFISFTLVLKKKKKKTELHEKKEIDLIK